MMKKIYRTPYGEICYWIGYVDYDRPWLVFLPGLTADHHLFDKQIAAFHPVFNCMVWDAPAHGRSRPFELKFSMDDMARYLFNILQLEDIDRPVLIGQSMGGFLSQVYMELYPNTVSGFIAIDSAPMQHAYYTEAEVWFLKHTEKMYLSIPWKLLVQWGSHGTAETRYGRSVMKLTMENYEKQEYCALAAHGYRIVAEAVEMDRAYSITCPVLLLCGKRDSAGSSRRYSRNWAKKEGYPLIWIPAAGHNSNTDMPDFVNKRIEQFVLEISE